MNGARLKVVDVSHAKTTIQTMTTTRPAKLSGTMLAILGEAAPNAARALSSGDALIAAATGAGEALEKLKTAADLHRAVGSATTLALRDAAEQACKVADDREFMALEAHTVAQDRGAIRAA